MDLPCAEIIFEDTWLSSLVTGKSIPVSGAEPVPADMETVSLVSLPVRT
jgi:hypothetical protein